MKKLLPYSINIICILLLAVILAEDLSQWAQDSRGYLSMRIYIPLRACEFLFFFAACFIAYKTKKRWLRFICLYLSIPLFALILLFEAFVIVPHFAC